MNIISKFTLVTTLAFLSTTNALAESSIEINVVSSDIVLERSKTKSPSVVNSTDKFQVTISIENQNGDLYVSERLLTNSASNTGKLIIYVPNGYRIDAKGMSSNFRINSACGSDIEIRSMSGDIKSNCLSKIKTRFESMSGDIKVKALLATGIHRLDSMSGDVNATLQNGSSGKVSAISEKGLAQVNQEVVTNGKLDKRISEKNANLIAKTISGDAIIEF